MMSVVSRSSSSGPREACAASSDADRTARDALRKVLGHKFKDCGYIVDMKVFEAAKERVVSCLMSIGVTSDTFSVCEES